MLIFMLIFLLTANGAFVNHLVIIVNNLLTIWQFCNNFLAAHTK